MSNAAEQLEQTTIPLARVRRDGGTQMRESISEVTVVTYAEHMQDGAQFPAITVFFDGTNYWLADGFHRCAGYERAEIAEVPADIRSGTQADAIRFALKANAENGRPRTSDDMRRAYRVAVEHGLCEAHDAATVKELLGCSMRWANRLTQSAREAEKAKRDSKIVELAAQGKTQREIAAEVGGSVGSINAVVQKGNGSETEQETTLHPAPTRPEESANDDLAEAERAEQAARRDALHAARGGQLPVEEQKRVHVSANSGNNEWYTPPEYIELARAAMGSIDTDPATSEFANQAVKAPLYYTAESDGRDKEWRGNVWMNPPYAQPLMGDFAEAVTAKYLSGEISQACILVNNATETAWFQRMMDGATAVALLKGRVRYLDSRGSPANSPLQGQAVVYMGGNVAEFKKAFSAKGRVLTND